MPAARRARAKYTMFSANRPAAFSGMFALGTRGRSLMLLLRRPQLRAHLVEHFLGLGAFEARDVVLIFEQHAERVGDGRGIERHHVKFGERARPIESLGDARR